MRMYNNEENTQLLVHRYEEMIRNDQIGFLDPVSFERLVDYYEQRRQINNALKVVEYALSQYAYSATFYIRNAQLLYEAGKDDEALFYLEKAQMLDNSELEIFILKAEIYSGREDFETAEKILQYARSLACGSDLSEVYLAFASIYEDMDRHDKVFDALRQALLINPKNTEALERIWLAFEIVERYEESIELHLKIVDEEPYSHLAWYNLAHSYFSLKDYEKAIDAYEFVLVIEEKFEYAYLDCGECYFKLELFEKAIGIYEDALQNLEPSVQLLGKTGHCYEELGVFKKAKEFYFEGLKLEPDSDFMHYRLGECYMKEENWKSAIGSYKRAIYLNSCNSNYQAALGLVYFQMGDHDSANEFFSSACDMAPDESDKWIKYAIFLQEINLPQNALDIIEEASMYCDRKDLPYCKAACLFSLGRRKEGMNLLRKNLVEQSDQIEMLYLISPELEEDEEIQMAIYQFKEF